MLDLDDLLCLFSAKVKRQNGKTVIEIPDRELEVGDVVEGEIWSNASAPHFDVPLVGRSIIYINIYIVSPTGNASSTALSRLIASSISTSF
jgi:hypothetical protein